MNIYIDRITCPNSIVKICEESGIPIRFLRDREPDLYKQSSEDFEREIELEKEKTQEKIGELTLSDFVVTKDLDLARDCVPRAFAVLHPNGFVFNPKSLMRMSYEEFIKKENLAAENQTAEKLKKRNTEYDEKFREVFESFLKNI